MEITLSRKSTVKSGQKGQYHRVEEEEYGIGYSGSDARLT